MRSSTHGGRILDYAEISGLEKNEIVDFSANINPFGPPKSVINALQDAILEIVHYPDSTHRQVKPIIGKRYGIETDRILCGNGATEVMELFFRYVKPKRTWVIHPAFSEYAHTAKRYQSHVLDVSFPFPTDIKVIFNTIFAGVKTGDCVILNNPHNPTGKLYELKEWAPYLQRFEEMGVYTVVDESFMDFIEDAKSYTAIPFIPTCKYLFIVRSATKIFSIPGLRFGFGIGNKKLIAEIEQNRDGWSVNHLAQMAAIVAYEDNQFINDTYTWLKQEQQYVQTTWGEIKLCSVFPTSINFFLVQFHEIPMNLLYRELAKKGMFVRSCTNFRGLGETFIRTAIRTRQQNEQIAESVYRICKELSI